MKYRIEMGYDGFPIYIAVPDDTEGRNVYDVGTGSDGNLTHTPTTPDGGNLDSTLSQDHLQRGRQGGGASEAC